MNSEGSAALWPLVGATWVEKQMFKVLRSQKGKKSKSDSANPLGQKECASNREGIANRSKRRGTTSRASSGRKPQHKYSKKGKTGRSEQRNSLRKDRQQIRIGDAEVRGDRSKRGGNGLNSNSYSRE